MSNDDLHQHFLKMLVIITDRSLDAKVKNILNEFHIPVHFHMVGRGTAGSEMLEICGIDGTARTVTFCVIRDLMAPSVFHALKKYTKFNEKGTGIAFTIPINGAQSSILKIADDELASKINEKIEKGGEELKNSASYSIILTICKKGYSSEVMEVAKKAGATGGTVLKCRRDSIDSHMSFLGISTEEEREIVSILVPRTTKRDIMQAICTKCPTNSQAQCVVFSLPVDEMIGLTQA